MTLAQAAQPLTEAKGPSETTKTGASLAPSDKELTAWVDQRVKDWQPTKDERRFDEIGWAKDIREAKHPGKQHDPPVFLFTMKGHVAIGRC